MTPRPLHPSSRRYVEAAECLGESSASTLVELVAWLAARGSQVRRAFAGPPRFSRLFLLGVALLTACLLEARPASAVPAFARKYGTSCTTCHTIFPVLNPFGEAFRRNGYRFPSQNGSRDGDATIEEVLELGRDEHKRSFPDSVWPAHISKSVPLSAAMNGSLAINLPDSDAHEAQKNTFTWNGVSGEFLLFGAGAFDNQLTYFAQLAIPDGEGISIETAYLLWNDLFGPRHAVNLWVGRLMNPQLNSFGLHSSYLTDAFLPATSAVGLYNSATSFTLGRARSDGIELNGILFHRLSWSLGWVASSVGEGLGRLPNAEDAYAHIGVKTGGVALDGEGRYGPNAPDPSRPWAERALTFDVFAYRGLSLLDNGTGTVEGGTAGPVAQRDTFYAGGASLRAQWDSLVLNAGAQFEHHRRPYAGSAATLDDAGEVTPGSADTTTATSLVQYAELDYVVYPWLVAGLRSEYVRFNAAAGGHPHLLRLMPGVAMLARANVKLVISGDLEEAAGVPEVGEWSAAGGTLRPRKAARFQAEQVFANLSVAF